MNFCRNCGTSLAGRGVGAGTPMPGPGAMAPPPAMARPPEPASQACPTCGGQTPTGFAFCQQCGNRLAPRTPAGQVSPEAVAATRPIDQATEMDMAPSWGTLVAVQRDGTDGQRFPLRGEWMEIGRQADISFPDDPFLARRHARIEHGRSGTRIVPLEPLNGVFRRVAGAVAVEDGDVILAGREVMRFELISDEERAATPLTRLGVTLFGSPPREPWARLVQVLPSGGVRDVRHLDEEEIVIGREEGDLVFTDDAFLSRRHAALRWRGGRCTIEDLRSSNGTFVRLRGTSELRSGDHVRLGDQLFRFELG